MGCFLLVMAALLIGMVFVHDFVNPGWLLWLECPGHAPARIAWNRSSRIET